MKRMMRRRRLAALILCLCFGMAAYGPGTLAEGQAAERLPDHTLMQFFEYSLFVGDSQIRNFGNQIRKFRQDDPDFFPHVKFFGEYSFQMRMMTMRYASSDPEAIQLTYNGRDASLTDIALAEHPRNIFILIGLNDRIFEHFDRAGRYIDKILALRDEYFPETGIYFLSLTPVTDKRSEKTRDLIAEYNAWLEEKCSQVDATYINITAGLTDENGWLPKAITTDADSHLNAEGFAIFINNLLDYAQACYEAGLWTPETEAP